MRHARSPWVDKYTNPPSEFENEELNDCNLSSALTNSSIVAHCSVGNGSSGDQSFIQSNGTASMIPLYNYSGANAVFDSALCAVSGFGDLA